MQLDSASEAQTGPLVFVVDDEEILAMMAESLLQREGMRTQVFLDPGEALTAFQLSDPKPDLLITDWNMAHMTGSELIDECRRIYPGLKTLLLSGTVGLDFLRGQSAQADRFLAKPYKVGNFLNLVQEILRESPSVPQS